MGCSGMGILQDEDVIGCADWWKDQGPLVLQEPEDATRYAKRYQEWGGYGEEEWEAHPCWQHDFWIGLGAYLLERGSPMPDLARSIILEAVQEIDEDTANWEFPLIRAEVLERFARQIRDAPAEGGQPVELWYPETPKLDRHGVAVRTLLEKPRGLSGRELRKKLRAAKQAP